MLRIDIFLAAAMAATSVFSSAVNAQTAVSVSAVPAAGRAMAGSASAAAVSFACPQCLPPSKQGVSSTPVRAIEDPFNGQDWLLVRDEGSPAGPGRLIRYYAQTGHTARIASPRPADPVQVIRAGDNLLIEEHSDRADIALHAVALAPAIKGKFLSVRLVPGGGVLRVIAASPGRATLATTPETRP